MRIRHNASSIVISIREEHRIALCELDYVPMNMDAYKLKPGTWFYFNRLKVPHSMRRKGIATRLMTELVEILDNSSINVLLEVNPYGDGGPELEDLIKFYSKFGFIRIQEMTMYRYAEEK